jgi:phosphoribosylformimino-5-aminoimidazole carboxamide ribotide isomerase
MSNFTIFPAIDLRGGKVVRLKQGDPTRQTTYADDPAAVARRWLDAGARWLHVVNLDGAFGERSTANQRALGAILSEVAEQAQVQLGGGLRTLAAVENALALGVRRVVLGTVAVENPSLVEQALKRFGPQRIVAGIDARQGRVRIRGWGDDSGVDTLTLGSRLFRQGVRTVVFTDIVRDGVGSGVTVQATRNLADSTGLAVIASGGVATLEDIQRVRQAGLAGVIIGRALYEGQIDLEEALQC